MHRSCHASTNPLRALLTFGVEAGLQTGNLQVPWPEESNCPVAGLPASLQCAPTRLAAENLPAESLPPQGVDVTGNTVIDALLWTVAKERHQMIPVRAGLATTA